jgi:hypothetical protein
MAHRQHYIDAYHAAMKREQDLWALLRDKQPGSPRFDSALWDKWLAAVNATNAASKAMREAFSEDSKLSDLS